MKPANVPSPPLPIFWLIKYLIHGVRNFESIILKRLLLYQLASRQHFYFGEYLVSWCNQLKNRNIWYLSREKVCTLDFVQSKVISR